MSASPRKLRPDPDGRASSDLTDLERAVLGVVWRDGPCTPYKVRKEFLDSPTPSWSGSAGTIYPLVQRLEGLGLLASRDAGRDRRKTKLCSVTPAGRRALKSWLRPPLPRDAVVPGIDPIRTRLLFIELLPVSERARFLDDVSAQLDDAVRELRELVREAEENRDRISILAARGGLAVGKARQRWFRQVRDELR